jgi:hypothetical protein
MLLKVMPALFAAISLTFPAGLIVYFLATNMYRIAQNYYITRRFFHAAQPALADGAGNGSGPPAKAKPPAKGTPAKSPPARPQPGNQQAAGDGAEESKPDRPLPSRPQPRPKGAPAPDTASAKGNPARGPAARPSTRPNPRPAPKPTPKKKK